MGWVMRGLLPLTPLTKGLIPKPVDRATRAISFAVPVTLLACLMSAAPASAGTVFSAQCDPAPIPASGGARYYQSSGKSEAILGQGMSAFDAMRTAQTGTESRGSAELSAERIAFHPEAVRHDQKIVGQLPKAGFVPIAGFGFSTPLQTGAVVRPAFIVNQNMFEQALARLSNRDRSIGTAPFGNGSPTFRLASDQTQAETVTPVFTRTVETRCWEERPLVKQQLVARSRQLPRSGNPDLFGTMALPVSRTPLDGKWNSARAGGEVKIATAALLKAGGRVDFGNHRENIRLVNRWVNAKMDYVEDQALYGRVDHWASAGESLRLGRGDCEDYAIAKMQLLQASGVKANDMFLVIVRDLVRRADHALLVVRVDGELLVLDNETDQILNADEVHDYRPIMTYSANKKWLHGYAAKPARTQIASLAVGR